MIYNSVTELIGNTPVIRLKNIEALYNLDCEIYAKCEMQNPSGSIKDRCALFMLNDARDKGLIKNGSVIIEPTSGNTGIGLSMIGTLLGYKVIIVMPDNMSKERISVMKSYGASVVLTDSKLGMKGAIDKATELSREYENSFIPSQFENPYNPESHYKTTGVEIVNDFGISLDYFVSSIGTGGTISGTAKYLKENSPNTKIIGIEPKSSPLITEGVSGSHKIQGIGANFIPSILDLSLVDRVLTVSDEDAYKFGRLLSESEGLLCGISSGSALYGAIQIAKENKGKKILAILPDTGLRYLSVEGYL
ncbi:MAG: cysteine synthase A [Clostridia bacterium]|nr:cysteine synthase A [Clostridia bacterium]